MSCVVFFVDVFLVHWDRREYNKNLLITTKSSYFNKKIASDSVLSGVFFYFYYYSSYKTSCKYSSKCCKTWISSSVLRFHSLYHHAIFISWKTNTVMNIQTSCCQKDCSLRIISRLFCLLINKTSVWWRCFYPSTSA